MWKPRACIHSEVCRKTLPDVYKPDEKPWIKVDQASSEALKAQIDRCPSGALSYYINGEKTKEAPAAETKVQVLENGPLLVHGTLEVTDISGNTSTKENTTAFCRCGASNNKPYCDGSHSKIDFKG